MVSIRVEKPTAERLKELAVETWSTWECGVETFDWQYPSDETAYVKAGRVTVRTEHGQEVTFGAGDLVFFPQGLRCTWTVHVPVRKVYVME
ncbi:MAG: cupin domain-containing protein [Deltaproteobacteria bacterium]|nr:cupin domain-containing protein [Deltaproteobacteria bacterium]